MAVTTTKTNKPINPRGNDQSPKGYNRAALYSGKALDFDGVNDYVDCGTLDVTAYTAISMSFNFQLANTTDNGLRLVSLLHSGVDDIRIEQGLSVLRITLDDGTAYTLETPSLTANEWNKFDMTFNGTTLEGYINGVSIGSISASFNFSTANGLLNLFKHSAASSYAEGLMSGFKIFNTALTAAQVADLYNNPEKIVPTGVEDTALKLWLPMMEGAGTTAYDGSGNGNHGTISGATWTHGVGSPVAQTAVIDWNKGQNLLDYSDIQQTQGTAAARKWTEGASNPWTPSNATGPTGLANSAGTYTKDVGVTTDDYLYCSSVPTTSGETYTMSAWVKLGTASNAVIVLNNSSSWNTISGANYVATAANGYDEWKQVSITYTASSTNLTNIHIGYHQETGVDAQADGTFYVYGVAIHKGSTPILVPTNGTAQTSDVLLPQGLTSGRDITGVNLFENVRKQGALNLDGNSWAEVHDNASLDMTTGVSVECWVNVTEGSANKMFISKWSPYADDQRSYLLYLTDGEYLRFSISSDGQNSHTVSSSQRHFGGWKHFVATYDKTTLRLYVNGAAENTAAQTADINVGTFQVEIGRHQGDTSAINPDSIAQPRIYNRALTAEEVERNFTAGKYIYTND